MIDNYEKRKYYDRVVEQDTDWYENTKIYKNKFNIRDQKTLDEYERNFTALSLLNMNKLVPNRTFDVEHYKNIHKALFQRIYYFAGELRGKDIIKDKTYFCRAYYIHPSLENTLKNMKKEMHEIESYKEYIYKLSKYYLELNLIHPFREGNGRTLREFIRQYIKHLNNFLDLEPLEIDYTRMDKEKLLNYTIMDSIQGICSEFNKALVKKETLKKVK